MSQDQNRLEARIDVLDNKLDAVIVEQAKMTIILEKQHESLVEHMKRTTQVEEALSKHKAYIQAFHLLAGGVAFILGAIKVIVPLLR